MADTNDPTGENTGDAGFPDGSGLGGGFGNEGNPSEAVQGSVYGSNDFTAEAALKEPEDFKRYKKLAAKEATETPENPLTDEERQELQILRERASSYWQGEDDGTEMSSYIAGLKMQRAEIEQAISANKDRRQRAQIEEAARQRAEVRQAGEIQKQAVLTRISIAKTGLDITFLFSQLFLNLVTFGNSEGDPFASFFGGPKQRQSFWDIVTGLDKEIRGYTTLVKESGDIKSNLIKKVMDDLRNEDEINLMILHFNKRAKQKGLPDIQAPFVNTDHNINDEKRSTAFRLVVNLLRTIDDLEGKSAEQQQIMVHSMSEWVKDMEKLSFTGDNPGKYSTIKKDPYRKTDDTGASQDRSSSRHRRNGSRVSDAAARSRAGNMRGR